MLQILKKTTKLTQMPPFFMNVGVATLKNTQFMGRLVAFLGKNRDLAERIVLEIKHGDYADMPIPVLQIMSGLGKLGVRFSIDHVERLDLDIEDLQRFNVKFVKAPAQMFLKAARSERDFTEIWRYKRMLEGNGIGLIVEKIENEAMMRDLLDYDLHYGQGFLFGRPDVQGAYEPGFAKRRVG